MTMLAHHRVGPRPDNSSSSRLCPERCVRCMWLRAASSRARLGVPGCSSLWVRAPLHARLSPRCPRAARLSPTIHTRPQARCATTALAGGRRTPQPLLFPLHFALNAMCSRTGRRGSAPVPMRANPLCSPAACPTKHVLVPQPGTTVSRTTTEATHPAAPTPSTLAPAATNALDWRSNAGLGVV